MGDLDTKGIRVGENNVAIDDQTLTKEEQEKLKLVLQPLVDAIEGEEDTKKK